MNRKLIEKLILIVKRDIDQIIVIRSIKQNRVDELQKELLLSQENLEKELQIASNIYFCETASFTAKERTKQKLIIEEIDRKQIEINQLSEEIVKKDIEKQKYEHLLKDIQYKERKREEKEEEKIIDAFALVKYGHIKNNHPQD